MTRSPSPTDPAFWSGTATLARVEGGLDRYPVARVLFLASRNRVSGQVEVSENRGAGSDATEAPTTIQLSKGEIVQITGLPGLFSSLDRPAPDESVGDLLQGLSLAVGAGITLDEAMSAAVEGLVGALRRWVERASGTIRFLDHPPEETTVPLPQSPVLLLGEAIRGTGIERKAGRATREAPHAIVKPFQPDDVPVDSWGLDALSLRVLRLTRQHGHLASLVDTAAGGSGSRRREVIHRVAFLVALGLLHISAPRAEDSPQREPTSDQERKDRARRRSERRSARRRAARRDPLSRSRTSSPSPALEPSLREMQQYEPSTENPPATDADEDASSSPPRDGTPSPDPATRLLEESKKLADSPPLHRLELEDARRKPTREEIDTAFRQISKRYHPDRHSHASAEVQRLAAECFSLLNEAHEALGSATAISEEWRRVECEREGVPYVSTEDYTRARIAFKKGELQLRNRSYAVAEACLAQAVSLDPTDWRYVHLHTYAAFLARQMPAEEALERLRSIEAGTPADQARVQITMGNILRLSGASDETWLACFQKARRLDPENRDAQREFRLREMRGQRDDSGRKGLFGRLLNRDD